eukprot:m.303598 g.303598  ORF g.303598 m.303598 type:complete len:123 (-) comp55250_c0_seq19:405-773(-)
MVASAGKYGISWRHHHLVSSISVCRLQGMEADFARVCEQTTDFHFADFQTQLRNIQGSLAGATHSHPVVDPGDFYVTRHSNLADIQVVIHLVVAPDEVLAIFPLSFKQYSLCLADWSVGGVA